MNGRLVIRLQLAADLDAVLARHHHVEQDEIGRLRARGDQRLIAVSGRDDLVALPRQAGLEDLEIGRVVVDHQNARRLAHGSAAYPALGQELGGSWRAAGAG